MFVPRPLSPRCLLASFVGVVRGSIVIVIAIREPCDQELCLNLVSMRASICITSFCKPCICTNLAIGNLAFARASDSGEALFYHSFLRLRMSEGPLV
ncbi:hypothetical protein VNO78_23177 [Psophocarpus tetragonolobus]|uniref:Uncharacterized protein n=1 Tax=Psophocarpus tetragonolobus TaxID=3891 RepID=A0AAN9S4E5_PSOTE